MKRPWQVWLAFGVCSGILLAAMAWLSVHALRVDRERSAARAETELEQRVSLALWRMDTKLAPLIAEEIARPHQFYDPFITISGPAKGEVARTPSPLLTHPASNVILNFDATAGGQWKSPQAPPPELRPLAETFGCPTFQCESNAALLDELADQVDVAELLEQLPKQPLPQLSTSFWSEAQPGRSLNQEQQISAAPVYANVGQSAETEGSEQLQQDAAPDGQTLQQQRATRRLAASEQSEATPNDFADRNFRFQSSAIQEFTKQRLNNFLLKNSAQQSAVVESVSRPLWVGDHLLLARRVERDGRTVVQGSWLDWPRIRQDLLAETADLLPRAELTPVRDESKADPTRMLAALPVQLAAPVADAGVVDAPLRWALGIGWAALAAALAAVAILLWGVMALSERRAAFVSSVTHELRTPLTTFRMYAEMLAREMVPSPERRREYLETLKTEAERLTHLVENVLAYARLERGRRPQRSERTTPAALVERFAPRLAERAKRAEMELQCVVEDAAKASSLSTDVGVVEQILFNLVDNAAKYAARAEDRQIVLHARRDRGGVVFCVTDRGPGFASLRAAERSAPFSKSAQQAAETAPGVGLGLALCRRLAKELGGRLQISPTGEEECGASVSLWLPIG